MICVILFASLVAAQELLSFSGHYVPPATHGRYPVVVWHGLGDFCANPISMVPFVEMLKNITHMPVYCLEIGDSWENDAENGWLMPVDTQIDVACGLLGALQLDEFIGLGLSQGGLFMRGLLQRCDAATGMRRLITIGGPHEGVEAVPQCNGNWTVCQGITDLMDTFGVYSQIVQDHIAPANYWHDSNDHDLYLKGCRTLPDLNNALPKKNATYKARIEALETFVMVEFTKDTVVFPHISEWFGFFETGGSKVRIPLRASEGYQQNWLGLATLDKKKDGLVFLSSPTNHLQFTHEWFVDNLVQWIL